MRSSREFLFRLRQEAGNLRMSVMPPAPPRKAPPGLTALPDPVAIAALLRDTPFAARIQTLAEQVLRHEFPLLGSSVNTGPSIDWRRDYLHGTSSGLAYFRRVPYLDFQRVGDHKLIWELNRHQHLVVLAQAFLFTSREEFPCEIVAQLESWLAANPFARGINWASALEVAFRALSWIWVDRLAGTRFPEEFRARFLTALWRHGCYLANNLSIYFSPNTHLLGEAVALHALGLFFGERSWTETGGTQVLRQMETQVRNDGSHFEQSTYYHVYALDMFLLHAVLADTPPDYRARLARMAEFLNRLLEPCGAIPFLGDDDGGRLFHPYGARDRFGRATLAACAVLLDRDCRPYASEDVHEYAAWLFGGRALHRPLAQRSAAQDSRLFPDAGLAIMACGDVQVLVDAGPFGPGGAGHSHSDTLSMVVRRGPGALLIDPGTYTYLADPVWRNRFRGSAAHNTVRIAGFDQATPAGPFRWEAPPAVEVSQWISTSEQDFLDARCAMAAGFTHRRRVLFLKPGLVLVLDEIGGPAGAREIEQFWHPGLPAAMLSGSSIAIGRSAHLLLAGGTAELTEGGEFGWRSEAYGQKERAQVLRVCHSAVLPVFLAAALDLSAAARKLNLEMEDGEPVLRLDTGPAVRFRSQGTPVREVPAG